MEPVLAFALLAFVSPLLAWESGWGEGHLPGLDAACPPNLTPSGPMHQFVAVYAENIRTIRIHVCLRWRSA